MLRLGIDFGTCYSSAALLLEGVPTPINAPLTPGYSLPSSVFITEKGEILVGQVAEHNRQKNPQSYRREFKRDLGSPDPYTLGNVFMLPEELITEVLKKLKGEAEKVAQGRGEKSLTDALITVPATYSSYKRNLMQEAGVKAGFSQIQLLEEPVAAAIYYSHHAQINDEDIILVYDLGGGTFDVTLMQKQGDKYQVLGMPKGLPHCGGTDFDHLIYQRLKNSCSAELRQQLEPKEAWLARAIVGDLCRELKHQLSEQSEASIYIPMGLGNVEAFELTRDAFNEMISPLIEEALDCCDQLVRSAGKEWQQVNQILLVGGSSRIPYVKEAIEKRFKISPFLVDKPELAVCLGAAIYEVSLSSAPIPLKQIASPPPEEAKAPSEEAKDYYTRGAEKYQAGDYVGAIADFDQVIRLEPNNSFHYSNRGSAFMKQGDYVRAIADCDRAIRLDLNNVYAYHERGCVHGRQGDYVGAIADFDQAIRLDPNNAVFYFNRGNAYYSQGNHQLAITDYDQAIRINPNEANFYCQRGDAYLNQGDYQKAIADLDQAIRIDPNNVNAYNIRRNAHLSNGYNMRAIADSDEAIRIDPNNAIAYNDRGVAYCNLKEYPRAIADSDEAIRLNPHVAVFYFNRGNAYSNEGEYQQAIDDYNQALKRDPNFPEANSVRTQIEQIRSQLDGQKQKDATNYQRDDSSELKHREKETQPAFEKHEAKIKSNGRLSDGAESYFKKLIPYLRGRGFQCSQNVLCGNYTLDYLAVVKGWIPNDSKNINTDFTSSTKVIIPLIYIDIPIKLNQYLQKFSNDCLGYVRENALPIRSSIWVPLEACLICPIIVVDEIDPDLAVRISQEKPFTDVDASLFTDAKTNHYIIFSGVYVYGLKNKRVFFNLGSPNWGLGMWGDYFNNWRKFISSMLTR